MVAGLAIVGLAVLKFSVGVVVGFLLLICSAGCCVGLKLGIACGLNDGDWLGCKLGLTLG